MTSETEEWRPVLGAEGLYDVSSWGRVRSSKRRGTPGKLLAIKEHKTDRHAVVNLSVGGVSRTRHVHLLVAEAFLGPRPGIDEVRHLDGNSMNPRLSNLTYGTKSENVYDQVRHGVHFNGRKTHCPQGHEYSPENTFVTAVGNNRRCRTCHRERSLASYYARKARASPVRR